MAIGLEDFDTMKNFGNADAAEISFDSFRGLSLEKRPLRPMSSKGGLSASHDSFELSYSSLGQRETSESSSDKRDA